MSGAKPRYHVSFYDAASDEELGLLLTENGGAIGRVAQLASPWAAKVAGGPRTLTDLTDLSTYEQTDWSGGRGQDRFSEEDQYLDSHGLETRIKDQVCLGPRSVATFAAAGTLQWQPNAYLADFPIGSMYYATSSQAVRFLTVGAITCTHIVLKLKKTGPLLDGYIVSLQTSSGNVPSGTILAHAHFKDSDLTTSYQEITFTWSSPVNLGATTDYWIVIEPPDRLSDDGYMCWLGSYNATTPSLACRAGPPWYQVAERPRGWTVGISDVGGLDPIGLAQPWVSYNAAYYDLWFMVNDGANLAGEITVNPVRFDANWYCAADDTVYVWTTATQVWTASEHVHGQTVTALLVWGDYLWAARGAHTLRRMTAALAWGDSPGAVQANLLAEYQGYLYRTTSTNPSYLYYTVDGTAWAGPVFIGPGDWPITGMAGFRDQFTIVTTVGVWVISADWSYQVLDWKSLEATTNGIGALSWAKRSEMFIPVGFGTYRWTGASMVSCGPDQGTGLPAERAGYIAAFCGTVNWLFAALDAGASGTSAVLAYDGKGWHEMVRATAVGRRIRALGYDTTSSPPRLWYGEGNLMRYITLPDYSDNPYTFVSASFNSDGEMELSTWGSELMAVVKDWRALVVQSEGCTSTCYMEFLYEVDRTGFWHSLGTITGAAALHTLSFNARRWATKACTSGCTATVINIYPGLVGTGDMFVGDFVRIDGQVRQVTAINSYTQFTLHSPLAAAPISGAGAYPSSAAGYEIRLKVRMATANPVPIYVGSQPPVLVTPAMSPKLMALALYVNASPADRWQITLSVRVEDAMRDLAGGDYPWNATTLQTELERWIARPTPFTLLDIYGVERTVKVTNAVVSNTARRASAPSGYDSVARISLLEVHVGGSSDAPRTLGGAPAPPEEEGGGE